MATQENTNETAAIDHGKLLRDLRDAQAMIAGARAIACCPQHEAEEHASQLLMNADNILFGYVELLEGGAA